MLCSAVRTRICQSVPVSRVYRGGLWPCENGTIYFLAVFHCFIVISVQFESNACDEGGGSVNSILMGAGIF